MTLEDNTEIVHSECYLEGGRERVKVEIEKPVFGGFASAECVLPDYEWKDINGFRDGEISKFQEIIESMSHIIIRLAKEGGGLRV